MQLVVATFSVCLSVGTLKAERCVPEEVEGAFQIVLACLEAVTLVIQMLLCIYDFDVNARPLTENFVKAIGGFVGYGTCVSIGSTDACEGPSTAPGGGWGPWGARTAMGHRRRRVAWGRPWGLVGAWV